MTLALRLLIVAGIVMAGCALLLGPRWRGEFYRGWLRPRLIAFGILVTVFSAGLYLYRVYNALHTP
jgi:hypothetical protein